jgi:HSP20 family protein
MAVTDKLKDMMEELRKDLGEVKEQVRQLLPAKKMDTDLPVRSETSDHPIATLRRETNRLFDEFMRGWPVATPTSLDRFGDLMGAGWPRIDIDETDEEVRVRAELAGMERDEVDVSVSDGVLTIRGEKRHEEEDADRHTYRQERFYGAFSRSLPVPADVDLERIKAKMKSGLLEVTMPKLGDRKTRGRKISIG